jgi:hypothetical protein
MDVMIGALEGMSRAIRVPEANVRRRIAAIGLVFTELVPKTPRVPGLPDGFARNPRAAPAQTIAAPRHPT